MQPVRLVIRGDFWDSQIYRGRLYLTAMDASVAVYDWDRIVDSLVRSPRDRLAVTCALSRGDYFYQNDWGLVFDDADVKQLFTRKLNALASSPIEIDSKNLELYCIGEADAPWGLADDADLFSNHLYAATQSGVIRTEIRSRATKRNRSGIGKTEKIWEGLGLSLNIRRGGDLAVAAGADGLHEIGPLGDDAPWPPERRQISERHTRLVSYAYASVYGSSDHAGGYLAAFGWEEQGEERRRRFVKTFDDAEIFGYEGGISWASQEKICLSAPGRIDVVRYVQSNVAHEEPTRPAFESIGSIALPTGTSRIISGGVPFFGTVLEHDLGLLVLQSNGEQYHIEGPVTRWRVFPRSNRYENHLHVVLEDRIEIYSFNHDYFVIQDQKLAGIQYRRAEVRARRGGTRVIGYA